MNTNRPQAIGSLHVDRRPELPPLAWLLHLEDGRARLVCGSSVEAREDRFVEGAWAGDFDEAGLDDVPDVFGSGAVRTPSGWLLVPPSHTLEYLVLLRSPGGWIASNSLAFFRSWTNAAFQLHSRLLAPILVRIINGIHESPIAVETSAGSLLFLFHHNCLLGEDDYVLHPKRLAPPFPDYASYVDHLREVLALVAANAAAPARRRTYPLLATLSSGYDSAACAALAAPAGCREAITFGTSRSGALDDGSRIALRLGLSVSSIARPQDTHDLGPVELEFLSTGMHAEDVFFAAVSKHVTGRSVVTGFHGGRMWDVHSRATDGLSSRDVSGTSLGEFRLQRDFVHVPVPFVGAQRLADILAIARSAELAPYRLGRAYCRPIPRRIGEEAGVDRELFGQSKNAASLLVFVHTRLLSPSTQQAVRERLAASSVGDRLAYRLRCAWFRIGMHCYRSTQPLPKWLPGPARPFYRRACARVLGRVFRPNFELFEHTNPFMGLAFEYALSKVSERYRIAEPNGLSPERAA